MINIQVDENEVRKLYLEKIEEQIKKIDTELIFWDSAELKRRTGMSWGTIQKEFFFDPRFPKYKVGRDWRFPAEETKQFLINWLKEQPRN
ncbi:group-specific protein [Bacillus ginsengihumi]|uniref:Group-specific protein n=1 Tax=Heyndrickxia ginsengihumi TaxID=363870 RepID=A0A0A6VBQ1_9BACI|nr:group-specific protein [Heyndrickxia ginsengihumi]KHD85665.1 group-specific protein [Heyndrickxia ginsengihumi]NEY20526.1 group-specific protein [Heyndrickxia ginsengihumi]